MSEPLLADKIVLLHEAFDRASLPHAFGGALALVYYAEPRGTDDIDVNVFLPATEHERIEQALLPFDVRPPHDPAALLRDGQVRVWWGIHPVDVFYVYDAVHEAMAKAARPVEFRGVLIPILGPEHLIVCKVIFNRSKDWTDIEQLLVGIGQLDLGEIRRWVDHVVGYASPPAQRFEQLVAERLEA